MGNLAMVIHFVHSITLCKFRKKFFRQPRPDNQLTVELANRILEVKHAFQQETGSEDSGFFRPKLRIRKDPRIEYIYRNHRDRLIGCQA